jgi:serine/threonine protein kinase
VPDPALAGKLPPELAANAQYTIVRTLGRGGMGVVYLAHNTMLDRREVLKVMNKETLQGKGTYERFLREMRAAAKLNHPNVVTAYSALQWGNLLVFAMEYIRGHDLARVVKDKGVLPVAMACSFVHDAALGLQHAHERGMVHRDIKPANLISTRQGKGWTVKILDFGLAKASSEQPIDGALTSEGQVLGTVDFLAPEQAVNARSADIRADIYSLGCTLYFLLSGGPPFGEGSYANIVLAHQSIEAKPLNQVRRDVPAELAAVVAKMMAKDPSRRYQTPEEVAEALKPFLEPKTGAAGGPRPEAHPPAGSHVAHEVALAAPPTAGTKAATEKKSQPEVSWERLIAIPEPEGLTELRSKSTGSGRGRPWPGWVGPALAAGALLALIIAYAAWVF